MKTSDFYYDLPKELIAQDPLKDRSSSRLMCLDKETGEISHRHFYEVIDYLDPGDTLVIQTRQKMQTRRKDFLWRRASDRRGDRDRRGGKPLCTV